MIYIAPFTMCSRRWEESRKRWDLSLSIWSTVRTLLGSPFQRWGKVKVIWLDANDLFPPMTSKDRGLGPPGLPLCMPLLPRVLFPKQYIFERGQFLSMILAYECCWYMYQHLTEPSPQICSLLQEPAWVVPTRHLRDWNQHVHAFEYTTTE